MKKISFIVCMTYLVIATVMSCRKPPEPIDPTNPTDTTDTIEPYVPIVPPDDDVFTVGDVTFTMVLVEGGTFTMGSTSEQAGEAYVDEYSTHQVTLNDFRIGQTEVTQELWKAVMGDNPSYFIGDALPVECVSWRDCQRFILRLNQLTGRNFRLPTEAEWEYAARGGSKSQGKKYAGNNDSNEVAWCYGNAKKKTHIVAKKLPNELGLYDMSGNVWEWCHDWYAEYPSSSLTNPEGASSGNNRVNRGGSWFSDARLCRVSNRGRFYPDYKSDDLGFRLVLSDNIDNEHILPTCSDTITPPNALKPITCLLKDLSFVMIPVQGGTFTMGATSEQGSNAFDNEYPIHQVTLDNYYIGQTEVTQKLWKSVLGYNPSSHQNDDWPVERVTWPECQHFIEVLNWLTGYNFRLPTEAEWEFAARGGNQSKVYKYAGSDNIDEVAWYRAPTGFTNMNTVAKKRPNELRIYDMSGNVKEWCQDWYGDYTSTHEINPQGPTAGTLRVLRGGNYNDLAKHCRVTSRDSSAPSYVGFAVGLRLCLSQQ